MFVHQSKYHDVVKSLHLAYEQITIGDPLDKRNLMGPLIDKQAIDQFNKAIARIKEAGGQIVFGGEVIESIWFFCATHIGL